MIGLFFWLSLAAIVYVYAGYPVIIAAVSLFFRKAKNPHPDLLHEPPSVTLLICAYNEQAVIADKLENSLKLDYPKHRLQILVAADGSNDKTALIASSFAARGVELSFSHQRLGKMAAINRAMPLARGEIVIFSDANNFYNSDVARKLTAPFQDVSIGGVSGAKTVMRSKGSVGDSEGLYWRYEASLAKMETRVGCCCAVAGEIWAIRKHLWRPCPNDIINDDAFMALRLIKMGYRLIYVPEARSSEPPSQTLGDEFQRRARIIAGRYQLMAKAFELIPFRRPLVAWQIISHKFMRPWVPLAMTFALAANLVAVIDPADSPKSLLLLTRPYGWIMLTLQFIFYSSACFGGRLKDIPVFGRLFFLPKFLVVSNYSALVGLTRFIRGRQKTQWEKVQHGSYDSDLKQEKKDLEGVCEQGAGNSHIARKAALGVFWSFMSNGLAKGVGLLSLSILAHLLLKDDFGHVAAAMIALNYLSIFKDFGLGVALIQRRGDIEEAADTVFILNIVMGVVLATLAFVFAPLAATYFNEPQLIAIVRWLGLSFLINSAGAVHLIRLKRELAFRKKLIPDLSNTLVKGAVSIAMALSGFGVWSLVFGQLAGAVVGVIVVWLIMPWRPRLKFNFSLAGSLIKFGGAIMGLDALTVISENLASIIIGKICGMALLGVFALAYRLPQVLLIGNLWVMADVAFPAFSVIQHQPDEMRKGFLKTVRLVGFVASPLCLGMLLAADPIIQVFFGPQWLEAVPILRILAVCAWVHSIGFHVGDIYKAIGKADILLKLAVVYIVIELGAMLIGARYGLIGIATGFLLVMVIMKFVELKIATKLIDILYTDILKELYPALICGAVLTALALVVLQMTKHLGPLSRLSIVSIVCAAGYLSVLWVLEKENIGDLVRLIRLQA